MYRITGCRSSMGNIADDFGLPGTTYHVVMSVTESSTGLVLATESVDATKRVKVGP